MAWFGLMALGAAVGAIGSLIGAGGGFLLVPILLLLRPELPPESITAISLAAVLGNASIGSIVYARQGRIDYESAGVFSLASLPGAALGGLAAAQLGRGAFSTIFAVLLLGLGIFVGRARASSAPAPAAPRPPVNLPLGAACSALIGFAASFLGIGGGIIHVPILVRWLGFPVHLAIATSHLILAVTAAVAVAGHAVLGAYAPSGVAPAALALAAGAMLGAPLGARLSPRVKGPWLMRIIAVALTLVGLRLFLS